MSPHRTTQPRVFLSFAGDTRPTAERLASDLKARSIDTHIDDQYISPGDNIVLAINQQLDGSDYFVLLWSRGCLDNVWVQQEWSAAYAVELSLRLRRAFLFVLRLDQTRLPPLLQPRQYLDAFVDWDQAVDRLARGWHEDRAVRMPVLPAPSPVTTNDDAPRVIVRVRNTTLAVVHVLAVPARVSRPKLEALVYASLALPDKITEFNGAVGLRFRYQLVRDGEQLPDTASELDIREGTQLDLVVTYSAFVGDTSHPGVEVRDRGSRDLSRKLTDTLIRKAFHHLMP